MDFESVNRAFIVHGNNTAVVFENLVLLRGNEPDLRLSGRKLLNAGASIDATAAPPAAPAQPPPAQAPAAPMAPAQPAPAQAPAMQPAPMQAPAAPMAAQPAPAQPPAAQPAPMQAPAAPAMGTGTPPTGELVTAVQEASRAVDLLTPFTEAQNRPDRRRGGGSLYVWDGAHVYLENVYIAQSASANGGAVAVVGGGSALRVRGGAITRSLSAFAGAALYVDQGAAVDVAGNLLCDNEATVGNAALFGEATAGLFQPGCCPADGDCRLVRFSLISFRVLWIPAADQHLAVALTAGLFQPGCWPADGGCRLVWCRSACARLPHAVCVLLFTRGSVEEVLLVVQQRG